MHNIILLLGIQATELQIVTSEHILSSEGVFAVEVLYVVKTDTMIINAQTSSSINLDLVNTAVTDVSSNRITTVQFTSFRKVSNSLSFVVSTEVASSENQLFITALQSFYQGETVV